MQIIQQIREKGAAIVIVVIVLSLIGFILMDANLGMNRSAAGGRESLGTVNGKAIESKEFDAKVKMIEEQYGGRVSGAQVNMLRQNAWDQLVFEKVAETEFEKLGITFTPKELTALMFSDDAPQSLKQAFTDKETGQYDLTKVQQWWANAKKSKGEQKDAVEAQVIEPMRLQALYNKYSGMVAASAYYPAWMKEKEANEAKAFANISYVAVPYSTISDSTVKVSDEDVMSYISKRKAMYKQEGGRQIAYVGFSSNPSAADTAKALETVTSLAAAFTADTNAQVFLSRNASAKEYENAYLPKSKLPAAQKDTLAALAQGAVYGPYFDGKDFVLAKKIKTRMLGDSIKCRHILIGTVDRESGQPLIADSVAKLRADSIELAVRAGANFDELEAKYSTDKAAHEQKGVMTFDIATVQNPTGFAPEFAEFLLNEKGETRKVVKTNFGWHYIEMLQIINPAPAYNIAYMAKEVSPSEETIRIANNNANNLAAAAKNVKSFDDYVAKNKLQKIESSTLVKENDYSVGQSLQDARQLVRWANEAKEGDVSEPFTIGDQFVVGVLTKIVPEGLPDAKTARPMVEAQVRNQKKAEQIKAKLTATPTLESAAAAYPGLQVATAGADSSLVFSSSIINGIGAEPKIIGASFDKANQAKVSGPIEGANGVYVVKVNSVGTKNIDAPAVDKAKTMAQQLSYGWFEALKKLATIKDERSKVF